MKTPPSPPPPSPRPPLPTLLFPFSLLLSSSSSSSSSTPVTWLSPLPLLCHLARHANASRDHLSLSPCARTQTLSITVKSYMRARVERILFEKMLDSRFCSKKWGFCSKKCSILGYVCVYISSSYASLFKWQHCLGSSYNAKYHWVTCLWP